MKKMLWTIIVVWAVVSTAQEAEQAVKAEAADKPYNIIMFGDLHYDNMGFSRVTLRLIPSSSIR